MRKIEPTGVNNVKLSKGLRTVGIGILLMFIGPVVLNSSFKNPEHILYYPVMILGGLLCAYAMYLFYKGLKTMVRGIFDD